MTSLITPVPSTTATGVAKSVIAIENFEHTEDASEDEPILHFLLDNTNETKNDNNHSGTPQNLQHDVGDTTEEPK